MFKLHKLVHKRNAILPLIHTKDKALSLLTAYNHSKH